MLALDRLAYIHPHPRSPVPPGPESEGLSKVFSSTTTRKHQFFGAQPPLWSNSHICTYNYWKNHSFDYTDFVGKVVFLLFNMLFRFVIPFLPKSKYLLISWL